MTYLLVSGTKALMDHGTKVGKELAINYDVCCIRARENPTEHEKMINLGLRLGGFLSDAGWYVESERVLSTCRNLCITYNQTPQDWCRTLDCCHK